MSFFLFCCMRLLRHLWMTFYRLRCTVFSWWTWTLASSISIFGSHSRRYTECSIAACNISASGSSSSGAGTILPLTKSRENHRSSELIMHVLFRNTYVTEFSDAWRCRIFSIHQNNLSVQQQQNHQQQQQQHQHHHQQQQQQQHSAALHQASMQMTSGIPGNHFLQNTALATPTSAHAHSTNIFRNTICSKYVVANLGQFTNTNEPELKEFIGRYVYL